MTKNPSSERYQMRGVSADKEDVHAAIENIDKGLFPKAFCKIVPDYLTGDDDYCLVMHADGAGTKSSLAYMYWKKTGDLSVWKGIAQDALIMNIDDLLCVGAVNEILISSTIGRNKNHIPGEVIKAIIQGTNELVDELNAQGMKLTLTGGETADVGDLVRTIIVDSTVTARLKRDHVIDNATSKQVTLLLDWLLMGKPPMKPITMGVWVVTGLPLRVMMCLTNPSPMRFQKVLIHWCQVIWFIQDLKT